jgi:hypothetical protein
MQGNECGEVEIPVCRCLPRVGERLIVRRDNLQGKSRSLPFVHAHSEWRVWPASLLFRLGSLH